MNKLHQTDRYNKEKWLLKGYSGILSDMLQKQ